MDRETQIIKFLEENKSFYKECNISKERVCFWLRVMRNDFQRTDILDMRKVQLAIVDKFDPFEFNLNKYVKFMKFEVLSNPKLWKMYDLLDNKTAPEVVFRAKLKRNVKRSYNILVVHVNEVVKSVRSNEPKRHTKKKKS